MSKKIDRKELVTAIKACAGLTEKQKGDLTQLLNETPKYGLVWEDTTENAYEDLRTEVPVMYEDKSKAIINGSDYPNHVIIEGENLKALTDLCYTHAGKIDVIYIDPPYNTGNKDFVYNDQFIERENSYKHSKWLSFISRRLKLAHRLLSEKGIIFISIDDNEQADLKLLCDEIFREYNFIGLISRATGTTTGQDTGSLGKACDYILAYSLYPNYEIGGIPLEEKDLLRYSLKDEKGNFSILQLRRTGGEDKREDRPTMFYPIKAPDGTEIYPYGPTGYESRWRVGPDKMKQMVKDNLLYFKKDKNGKWKVYYKFYAKGKSKRPSNLWTDLDGNKKAQIELKNILGNVRFDTPKPLQVIKRILEITTNKESNILDFFAGSGTTLHATMELNKEDGGHRKCILIQNNESNICKDVTYPRNKKVIEGYDTPKGEHVEGLHDNNLRYFRMDSVPRKPLRQNRQRLAASMIDMLRIKHNVYTEKDYVGTLSTNPRTTRYYEDNGHGLLLLMDSSRIGVMVDAIKSMNIKHIDVYVYSDGSYAFDEDFSAVADKVSVYAIPGPMLRNFNRIAPEMPDETIEEPNREMTTAEAEDNSDDYKGEEE